jgi:hypothetical protein
MNADDQCNLIRNCIERQVLEQVADYVERGRSLAGRDFAELRRHWIRQMRLWSNKSASAEDHKLREDIQAEMRIRGFQPPYEAVKDELARLAAMSKAFVDSLSPQDRRRFNRTRDSQFRALRDSTRRMAKN